MSNKENIIMGKVGWKSPSNIALIKYWGKKNYQIPSNPSLSFTLSKSFTETIVEYSYNPISSFQFMLNGTKDPGNRFYSRLGNYFNAIVKFVPFLENLNINVKTRNTFPHSTGIASSASGFSALALCLCSIEEEIKNKYDEYDFFRRASFLSRIGSGSACRSVRGGIMLWGGTELIQESSDEYAIQIEQNIHPVFSEIRDAILITDSSPKPILSSEGHELMNSHPYASSRYKQANMNLNKMLNVLKSGNFFEFSKIVENEALSLHAMMMTSERSYLLINDHTLNIIKSVKEFRKKTGSQITFTLDAGPNVHIIYTSKCKNKVHEFIKHDLTKHLENGEWIDDCIGKGPEKIL